MSWRHRFSNGRWQSIPDAALMAHQREILAGVLSSLLTHRAAHGWVHGRSVETALDEHIGCHRLIHLDIANAFPSTTRAMVRRGLLFCGLDESGADKLISVCMEDDSLPVGAPTSPALFNASFRPLDDILDDQGCYSRYCDNLLFSSLSLIINEKLIRRLIREFGYRINERKSWHRVRGRQSLEVFGWVVGETALRRPRTYRMTDRAEAHRKGRDS